MNRDKIANELLTRMPRSSLPGKSQERPKNFRRKVRSRGLKPDGIEWPRRVIFRKIFGLFLWRASEIFGLDMVENVILGTHLARECHGWDGLLDNVPDF